MQELFFSTLRDCAERIAGDMADCLDGAVKERGHATLAVSGGRTPELIFPPLSRANISWPDITVTLTDERWVGADHPDSNEGLVRRGLLVGPAAQARFVGLKTPAPSSRQGREETETRLVGLSWPLDAVFLGMGEDGHVASLFPGDEDWMDAPGKSVAVAPKGTRRPRVSLTPKALLSSRRIFLVLSGDEKNAAYDAALKPGPVSEFPLRLVLHQESVPVTVYRAERA